MRLQRLMDIVYPHPLLVHSYSQYRLILIKLLPGAVILSIPRTQDESCVETVEDLEILTNSQLREGYICVRRMPPVARAIACTMGEKTGGLGRRAQDPDHVGRRTDLCFVGNKPAAVRATEVDRAKIINYTFLHRIPCGSNCRNVTRM
jgi:hypothetical protein